MTRHGRLLISNQSIGPEVCYLNLDLVFSFVKERIDTHKKWLTPKRA